MYKIIIIIFSAIGFGISYYIRHHRINNKELSCSLKTKCNVVVGSKYNKLLGFHNDSLGMLYYGIIALTYLISIKLDILEYRSIALFMLFVTGLASLYSVYLTLVQMLKIKEYCQWCLISAAASIGIFLALLF